MVFVLATKKPAVGKMPTAGLVVFKTRHFSCEKRPDSFRLRNNRQWRRDQRLAA